MAPARQEGARFDVVGFVLLAAGLVAMLSGVDAGSSRGWGDQRTAVPLLGALWLPRNGAGENVPARPEPAREN